MEDFRNFKQLTQSERLMVHAYIQGRCDTERELKTCNNSNTIEVFNKIRAEIDNALSGETLGDNRQQISDVGIGLEIALSIIDKYRPESADEE